MLASASDKWIRDFSAPSRGLFLIVDPSYIWLLSKKVININKGLRM